MYTVEIIALGVCYTADAIVAPTIMTGDLYSGKLIAYTFTSASTYENHLHYCKQSLY